MAGHVVKSLLELLGHERQLADAPDLGVGLEVLLVLDREGTGLDGDDGGSSLGVVVDGRAALAAEDTVDGLARGTGTSIALGRTGDGQLVLGDDGDERVCGTSLALAVVAVVVGNGEGRRVNGVLDLAAKAVTGETHFVRLWKD